MPVDKKKFKCKKIKALRYFLFFVRSFHSLEKYKGTTLRRAIERVITLTLSKFAGSKL